MWHTISYRSLRENCSEQQTTRPGEPRAMARQTIWPARRLSPPAMLLIRYSRSNLSERSR